jgi:GT2 family glycosyltransferase
VSCESLIVRTFAQKRDVPGVRVHPSGKKACAGLEARRVPVVDVVVVCWNDRDKIAVALDSVFALPEVKYDRGFARVVVSDNGSTDGSRRYLRERYGDRLAIVENGENLGFGAACNRAFAVTDSPYVFLLNPDAQLKTGALSSMIRFMRDHPSCGIAGSRIYNLDGSIQESCGEFDTWVGAFLRSSAWGEWPIFAPFANGKKLHAWGHATERRVDIAIGAALCIRRRLIDDIGPFDERFFLYHEEVDFAKRAADAGWETWYVPASEAIHEGMGSARGNYNVETRKQTSRRKYWLKHHGRLWYATLVAALIGRYVLYVGILVSGIVTIRQLLSRRLR